MKRLSYMACLLLASAAFTACDEDFKDWADPQSNPLSLIHISEPTRPY